MAHRHPGPLSPNHLAKFKWLRDHGIFATIISHIFHFVCFQERRWGHGLDRVQLCVTEDGHQVVLRGEVPYDAEDDMRGKCVIEVRDAIAGELISQWESHCQHEGYSFYHRLASWSSNNTPYLAHSCLDCDAVHVYDISRGKLITQCKQQDVPRAICRGPGPDTLLLVNGKGKGRRILQLQWTGDSFKCLRQIHHNHPYLAPDICYSNLNNKIYLASGYTVSCISLSGDQSGQTLWHLGGKDVDVGGRQLSDFLSVCCDLAGRVYISELNTDRLLVVDGESGELLHVQSGMEG